MPLTDADVARLARLARLDLSGEQAQRTLGQLNAVLGLIEQLQAVDTRGVEPMTHPTDMALRLRPDLASEPNDREANQRSAPVVERGLFLVPKVIE